MGVYGMNNPESRNPHSSYTSTQQLSNHTFRLGDSWKKEACEFTLEQFLIICKGNAASTVRTLQRQGLHPFFASFALIENFLPRLASATDTTLKPGALLCKAQIFL